MKLFKPIVVLGIDIGSNNIRIVEISHTLAGKKLTKFTTIDASTVLKGVQTKDLEPVPHTPIILRNEIVDTVKKEIVKHRFRTKNLATATSTIPVNMIVLKLPYMTTQELEEALPREVRRRMIPIPPPDAIIRFKLAGDRRSRSGDMIDLIGVSADRKYVEDFMDKMSRVGLPARTITTSSFAMFNTYLQSSTVERGINVAMIDLGSDIANTIIVKDSAIRFSRDMSFGVERMIDMLSKNLDIPKEESRMLLRKHGIPMNKDEEEETQVVEGVDLRKLRTAIQPALDMFLGELRRSFIYYRDQFRGQKVSRIFLSGGGAMVKNLDTFLSTELGMSVEIFNPLKNIKVALPKKLQEQLNSIAPILTIAIGLGLELGTKNRVNLLPREIQLATRLRTKNKFIISAAAIISLSLLSVHIKMDLSIKDYRDKIAEQESMLKKVEPAIEENNQWKQKIALLHSQMNLLDFLSEPQPRWFRIFQDLSLIIPEDIVLEKLEIVRNIEKDKEKLDSVWKIEMSGFLFSDYETSQKILTDIRENLKKSYFSKDIIFDMMHEKDIDLLLKERRNFRISGYLEKESFEDWNKR